jgi:hypothetical protein
MVKNILHILSKGIMRVGILKIHHINCLRLNKSANSFLDNGAKSKDKPARNYYGKYSDKRQFNSYNLDTPNLSDNDNGSNTTFDRLKKKGK